MTTLLALWLLSSASAAENPVKLYDAGNYAAAAEAFEDRAQERPEVAARHYNLGNARFKDGKLGAAIAEYQRAFELLPRDSDIRYNLQFALRRAGEDLVPPGVPPFVFLLFHLLSDHELAGLHWLGAWATLILGALLLQKESWRPALAPYTVAAAVLWAGAGAWWGARRTLTASPLGVIVRETAELRSGPGDNFGVSFTAPEGRRVQILSDTGEWLEIGLLKEGSKGWIAASSVEKI
jgi:tetratricopeptide (TPR) repeat protein